MTNFLVLSSDLLDEEPLYDAEAKVSPLPVRLCFESFLNKAGENIYTCTYTSPFRQAKMQHSVLCLFLSNKNDCDKSWAPLCFCNRRSVGQLFLCCYHVSAFDVCQLRIFEVNVSSKPQEFFLIKRFM